MIRLYFRIYRSKKKDIRLERASGSKNILGLLSSEDRDSTGLTSAVSVALGKTVMIGL